MELLLSQDVEKLGRMGDIVNVAAGHARNYLLPQRLAVEVTPANIKQIEVVREKAEREYQTEKAEAEALAEKLSQSSFTIVAKASEEGHLYGSVSAAMIAEAMQKEGFQIDAKLVQLEEPIKQVDVYEVAVSLHPDVEAVSKVWVVAE